MVQKVLIFNPFTEKDTKINPYGITAKKIYKYLIEAGSPPDAILPENLNYSNGRFKKIKIVKDTSNVRRITYAQVNNVLHQETYLKNIFKQYKGQTIQRVKQYIPPKHDVDDEPEQQVVSSEIIKVPTNFSTWWKKDTWMWIYSDTFLFSPIINEGLDPKFQAQVLILRLDKVGSENYQQYFLDGITHCLFTPIKDWAVDKYSQAESKPTQRRYRGKIKKIEKLEIEYFKGVPHEDIGLICNELQIGIEIDLPSTLGNATQYIKVEPQKKSLKNFRFINTRLNHIELNKVSNKDNYVEVTKKELKEKFNESQENQEFVMWKETQTGMKQLNTLDCIYKLTEEEGYNKEVKSFEDANNLRDYKIEHFKNLELSKFLLKSVNPNQSVNFHNVEGDNVNHIDMKKAYTRGSECNYYQGYLGKITDFRKTDKIMGLGIYYIENVVIDNPVFKKLDFIHSGNAYPSPELEFIQANGVSFDIVLGCWGSRFDIDFSTERVMMKKEAQEDGFVWTNKEEEEYEDRGTGKGMYAKEDGVSHYCKWYGCSMKLTTQDRYSFDCKNIDFAKLNQYANDDCDIRWNKEGSNGIIEYQKKQAYHSSHIASFVSSYSRITVMEQLLKFINIDNIKAVVVDGIYYTGEEDLKINPIFCNKEKKTLAFKGSDYYVGPECIELLTSALGEPRENNPIELHTGAGGCGKTHRNLTDKGLIDILFVAPSWKLARNKRKEYGCDSTTFYHILDSDPDTWKPLYKYYSTFIIDEVSMLSDEDKTKILKRFPHHKIIFCGDLGYQLPPIEGDEFQINNIPIVNHTTNHRCKCEKLFKILKFLRKSIENNSDYFNPSCFDKLFGLDIISADDIDYQVEDLIITKTHKNKDKYTEKYKDLKKYIVLENTRDYSNGEIIIGDKPEKVRAEIRHAYTVHSIQGETAVNKLFIDLNKMTCLRMLYTAISRAKYLSQIVFIK